MKLATPMAEPREPSKTELEVHKPTHLPPQQWCDRCVTERRVEHPHKRETLQREEPLEACLEWWRSDVS